MNESIPTHRQLVIRENGSAYDPETGEQYTVNATAAYILEQFYSGEDPLGVAEKLAARYGISTEAARQDVSDFLVQLSFFGFRRRQSR